jgi:hypothetical protein
MSATPNGLFEIKAKLLCEGLRPSEEVAFLLSGQNPSKVLRGGLSSGGKIELISCLRSGIDCRKLPVNVPLYYQRTCDLTARLTICRNLYRKDVQIEIFDKGEFLCVANIIPSPAWYGQTVDDIPITRILTAHNRQLAASVFEDCSLFHINEQCQFCVINKSSSDRDLRIIRKSPELFLRALEKIPVSQYGGLTLNGGMTFASGRGIERIEPVVRAIHAVYPQLAIAVEITPPEEVYWIDQLEDAGAESLMMNLECWDEVVRDRLIPGKNRFCPRQLYLSAFERAVKTFGRGQVSTCFVVGTEPMERLKEGIRQVVDIGVIPSPLAGRYFEDIPDYPFVPDVQWQEFVSIIVFAKQQMLRAGLVTVDRAGCVACGMCDAVKDV